MTIKLCKSPQGARDTEWHCVSRNTVEREKRREKERENRISSEYHSTVILVRGLLSGIGAEKKPCMYRK